VAQVLHALEERFAGLFGSPRRAQRYQVACEARLPVGVSMPNERIDPEAEHYPEPILGRTRDVSESGLSLVLPWLSLGEERIDVPGYLLRIVLCLPSGIIVVHAETVRSESLVDDAGRACYLVGARITRMSAQDEQRYQQFLRALADKQRA
jgi:hypothetical protein